MMKRVVSHTKSISWVCSAVGVFLLAPSLVVAQSDGYRAPRTAEGTPDFNGIWQALSTAHWDIEPHGASQGNVKALGALNAMPGGLGVVEGDAIPYRQEAREQRNDNFANRLVRDPAIKCYLPGVPRATYMPYPFQIIQSQDHGRSICRIMFQHRHRAGWAGQMVGGKVKHWSSKPRASTE